MADGWVWCDFENTPHVLFLEPIVRRLAAVGWQIHSTAKPQAQTLELAATRGLEVAAVGGGGYRRRATKILGGLARSVALAGWVLGRGRPRLLVSSSRTASLAAWLLRIPAIGLVDYEHSEHQAIALACRSVWFPDILRHARLPWCSERVARFYPGLKENLYLDSWAVNRESERATIGVRASEYVVVARPPAVTAHYASQPSERLFYALLDALGQRPEVQVIVVPRTAEQRGQVVGRVSGARVRVLERAVAGPSLVAASDLVLGGGGTMNREAAVLGIPVWSVFTGPTPHIDATLAAEGRLRWVRSDADLMAALASPLPERRERRGPFPGGLAAIMTDIEASLAA